MADPFAAYRLPLGLAEGVEIPLPNTPAVFTVTLPSRSNDEFQMRLMTGMNVTSEEDGTGTIDIDPLEFRKRRKQLFFDTCILKFKGLPKGVTPQDFFDQYPLAGRVIFEEAIRLGEIADKEVDLALGKSKSMPNGKYSGAESMISTKPSKKAASKSEPKDLN